MKLFFSYDPEGDGFLTHATAEEAEKAARDALDANRDAAAEGGWCEEPTEICWGEVTGKVVETSRQTACEYLECEPGCTGDHEYDTYVDYGLKPVQ